METIEQAIYTLLKNNLEITGYIPNNHMFYLSAPENMDYPMLVYQTISTTRRLLVANRSDYVTTNIQITVFGTVLKNMKDAAKAIYNYLHGFRGNIPNFSNIDILEIRQLNAWDQFDESTTIYQCYQLFNVYFIEKYN